MKLVLFSAAAAFSAFLVIVWAASVVWTARDAARRCAHVSLRIVSPLVALLVPFLGAAIYALVRPCEHRTDVRSRRMRTQMYEAMLAHEGEERCHACATVLQPEFRCCPACGQSVRSACGGCGRLVSTAWATCPWCEKARDEHDEHEAAALSEVA